jgi:hypothetical protein
VNKPLEHDEHTDKLPQHRDDTFQSLLEKLSLFLCSHVIWVRLWFNEKIYVAVLRVIDIPLLRKLRHLAGSTSIERTGYHCLV